MRAYGYIYTLLAFTIADSSETAHLSVVFQQEKVVVIRHEQGQSTPLTDPNNTNGLDATPGAYYWFSLDAPNQRLLAGVGEPRQETAIYTYQLAKTDRAWMETLAAVHITNPVTKPLQLLRDPITRQVPLHVKPTDALTMLDIAKGTSLPAANLSTVAQKLYNCIRGAQFTLNTPDFPDFAEAIAYSILTPTCWCYETLKAKSTEFGPVPNTKETYLRITLNENNGESPGIPYVMEIWPAGHYSPVHNHGGANAVIRVLSGAIRVKLFAFLGGPSFGEATFQEGDVTWISPTLNQVHQLENPDQPAAGTNTNKLPCITIQCYMYDAEDKAHYDYFDYLDQAGKIQQFDPNSDMDFVEFKDTIRTEWAAKKPRRCNIFQRMWRFLRGNKCKK